ncbi:MAG TPA: GspH/FimT family pseudopilin [Povalibacter sp.]|uniref:GspH/FimT family pseudopilin n=1 Tax=Povalibacter sp. TaxID=1962978 RepID=UPI002C5C19BF|nr:GspH/FimT family pseudopilin [Povalibacter sp.]HMN44084.1 GspH/FimT family pseudopilin [Povalibacter sp.]
MRARRPRSAGITLLEMMMTLTIVAILGGLAVPGFTGMIRDNERTTAVNSFVHALYLARSEAIKRGRIVSLCKSSNGSTCNNGAAAWSEGWMVFVNDDADDLPQRDDGEDILMVYQGWSNGSITSNRLAYSFRAYNQGVVNGTLLFCDARGGAHARAIIISQTGRPRVSQRDSSNKPLRCP